MIIMMMIVFGVRACLGSAFLRLLLMALERIRPPRFIATGRARHRGMNMRNIGAGAYTKFMFY